MPTRRKSFSIALSLLLLTGVATAQSHPGGGGGASPSATPNRNTQDPNVSDAADNQTNNDREFARKILSANAAAPAFQALVEKNSQNEDLKQLAKKMTDDRAQLASQLQPIAQQIGAPPAEISRKDKKLSAKLEKLSGAQFDTEFVNAFLKENQQELKDCNEESSRTQNSPLGVVAKNGVTMLTQHNQLLDAIAKSHNP
jgi:putative membrane protein